MSGSTVKLHARALWSEPKDWVFLKKYNCSSFDISVAYFSFLLPELSFLKCYSMHTHISPHWGVAKRSGEGRKGGRGQALPRQDQK